MPNNMVLLETIALTQSAASVTFDNLPTSGYTDLKIVMSTRNDAGTSYNDGKMTFNGSGSGYSSKLLYGSNGSTGSASASYGYAYWINASPTPGYTASTFSSTEVYIPNYTSSNYKSVSSDTVAENNGSFSTLGLSANLWSNTAAITSITFSQDYGNFVSGSTFSLYGIAALGTTPVLAPKANGGNIVANDGTYWYHAFTSSGNFVPQVGLTADVLVVAGGGGGGGLYNGAGGGAGGLRVLASQSVSNSSNYVCTIGAGGVGGINPATPRGSSGVASSIIGGLLSISSSGGGGGGSASQASGTALNGGSGGGAGASGGSVGTGNAGSYSPVEGYSGGTATASANYGTGGGGGAGGAGSNGTGSVGGNGGTGASSYNSISFSAWLTATNLGVSGLLAGGGGGSIYSSGTPGTANGGGSAGSLGTASNATVNTGGGGGGTERASGSGVGGAGGSGVVIIRYPIN